MATRLEGQKKPTIRLPATNHEWRQLMHQVLSRAEKARDSRAEGLRKALNNGQIEKHLRLMGIVCPADIEREFPEK